MTTKTKPIDFTTTQYGDKVYIKDIAGKEHEFLHHSFNTKRMAVYLTNEDGGEGYFPLAFVNVYTKEEPLRTFNGIPVYSDTILYYKSCLPFPAEEAIASGFPETMWSGAKLFEEPDVASGDLQYYYEGSEPFHPEWEYLGGYDINPTYSAFKLLDGKVTVKLNSSMFAKPLATVEGKVIYTGDVLWLWPRDELVVVKYGEIGFLTIVGCPGLAWRPEFFSFEAPNKV